MQKIIARLAEGGNLSEREAARAMTEVMEGRATEAQVAAFLMGLRLKGETGPEIAGCARVMRAKALRIEIDREVVSLDRDDISIDRETIVDTCGTGGDGTNTFNISTAAAFVVAGAGCLVAKHGNRSVSSACGSADVVRRLGVNIDLAPGQVARCVERTGIGFLYAPLYHAAMKYAVPVRAQLGIRTIFNLLGPLTNPASADVQVLGVYAGHLVEKLALVLKKLGTRSALVVHGDDSCDEISITGRTRAACLRNGKVTLMTVTPEEAGLARARPEEIRGGDAAQNARIILSILNGERGAPRDIVLLNAGAVLWMADRAACLADGVAQAARAVDSGRALARLEALVEFSNRAPAQPTGQ